MSKEIPIVFVHIGGAPPAYLRDAVRQARTWNPDAPIVCISSVTDTYGFGERWVAADTLPVGATHARFKSTTLLPGNGFWQWTTERLFVLEEWMRHEGVGECIHLENDIMVYQTFSDIREALAANSPGLSTTFQGQGAKMDMMRLCFSVLYCSSVDALSNFLLYLASAPSSVNEMERGGLYWLDTPEECFYLPTAPVGVALKDEMCRHWYEGAGGFPGIFDSSVYGQYLGGSDPAYMRYEPGFVNPDCDFRADQFIYKWDKDEAGRRYPVIQDTGGREWKLMNLHIHSKGLAAFSS